MSKIKFNTNRKNITDEQALKHKSFDKVMAGYKAMNTPLYKTFKFWAGAGVAVTTVVVATLLLTNNLEQETETTVKPPIAELDSKPLAFSVDAGKDTVIITESGSQIKISANSFVDKNGSPITGKVEINYREFHDVVDIFLSGIPMTYDSAGTQYHFESAGMFEIKGFQNHEEVFISDASPVNILLASKQEGERFNIYKLDDKKGEWSYIEKDTAGKIAEPISAEIKADSIQIPLNPQIEKLTKEVEKAKTTIKQLAQEKPVVPVKATDGTQNLKIQVDEKEFPELSLYKNLLFEIDKNDKTYKSELSKITWDAALVKKGKEKGTYILTFIKGKDEYSFLTRPVVSEKDYPKSVELYNKKFDEYEKTLAKRKEDEVIKQKELEAEYAKLTAERNAQIAAIQQRMAGESAQSSATAATTNIIYRSFMVSSFGIWNSDCPQNMPKGLMVSATFTDKNNKQLVFNTLYLVEKGKNAAYSLTNYDYSRFTFNPESENLLLGVTKDNKIAVFKPEDFAALGKIGSSCNFKMNVLKENFKNSDEVKAYLEI
jgi:frataxin-like iron-binding protein CyaY